MNAKRAFELLKKIGFTRFGGSEEEKKCAKILADEISSVNGTATMEEFTVNTQEITTQKLFADNVLYQAVGYGHSGNTGENGLTAPFYYMENFNDVDKLNAKGKIVLTNKYMGRADYKFLVESGAVGFITFCGDVIDKKSNSDLMLRELRPYLKEMKVLPGVNIRAVDAMRLVKSNPKNVTIVLSQKETTTTSQNVISKIKGEIDEEIVLTAHYDSVHFSKGVYDNGAGSVILMELYKHFMKNPPRRNLTFIWCGSEERGLLGSTAYVKKHKDEFQNLRFCLNVDVGAAVLGIQKIVVNADISLKHAVEYMAKEVGFSTNVTQDIYSSDSIPFANVGIPGINFSRDGANGGSHIHDRNDTMFFLSCDALKKEGEFVEKFADRYINSYVFPVPKVIPQIIVDKIDDYLFQNKG